MGNTTLRNVHNMTKPWKRSENETLNIKAVLEFETSDTLLCFPVANS